MPSESSTVDPCPAITGSASTVVRVAVVQLAYHAAIRGSLADPFGATDSKGILAKSVLPADSAVAPALGRQHEELSNRVQDAYVEQLTKKLLAILRTCRQWGVQVVVLPEYSVPAAALEAIAQESGGMVVVVGAGFVERSVQKSGVFERLGAPVPHLRQNVAVVLHGGRAIRVVAKLNKTPLEDDIDLVRGKTWTPVPLPAEFGETIGVLICLDFLERQYQSYTDLVAPNLDRCRFLAVPALTPASSLTRFHTHMLEEAGPRRRPVLFANHHDGGGSTIAVHERSLDELKDFPSHAGVFEAHEEGVLVADIDLAVVGVGKGGRYGECPPVKPFAAASLLYSGVHKDTAFWHAELQRLQTEDLAELDEAAALDRAIEWIEANPPPREFSAAMQKRRWNRLQQILPHVSSVEEVRRLTREVVLPADVLPLDDLEKALARGASRVIGGWVQAGIDGAAQFATVAASLEHRASEGFDHQRSWADAARQRFAQIIEAVRGEPSLAGVGLLSPLDRATDTIESRVVKAAIDDGNAYVQAGRYEDARSAYLQAHEEAVKQGTQNDLHGKKWLLWAARAAMGAAACAINLQDPDGARSLVQKIPLDVLDTERRLRLASIWAAVEDVDQARAVLPSSAEVPDELRDEHRDVLQRIGLVEGFVPPVGELSSSADIGVLAAYVLLGRHRNAARAAATALEALTAEDSKAVVETHAVLVLLWAVHQTVYDLVPEEAAIPVDSRTQVVAEIERRTPRLLKEDLPFQLAHAVAREWRNFLEASQDYDAFSGLPESEDADEEHIPIHVAKQLVEQGHVEAGLASLPEDKHPWRLRLVRIDLLRIADQSERALAEALELARKVPDRAPIELRTAQLLSEHGRHEDALAHARRAVASLPARGVRLRVSHCLLSLRRHQEAWEMMVADEATAGPRLLKALAIAADTVRPERALELWQRYVESRPDDNQARVHFAQLLFANHREQEAAAVAWRLFEDDGDALPVELLHAVGALQAGLQEADKRRRRRHAVAGALQQRFPGDPSAEQARLSLLVSEGTLDASSTIDFRLLEQAGVVQALSTRELVDLIRQQHRFTQLIAQLGQQGALPLYLCCEAVTPPITVPLLVVRLLRREQELPPFSAPVQLSDRPLDFQMKGADLLVSEVELYFLGALELLSILRLQNGPGRLHLFHSSWMRVVEQRETLRSTSTTLESETLGRKIGALAHIPRIRRPGPAVSDIQATVEQGGGVVSRRETSLREAGVAFDDIPEDRRISPRAVLRQLRERGRISTKATEDLEKHYPDDVETACPAEVPSPLLVRVSFLELLWERGALKDFLATFPTTHIGETDWRSLVDRQRDALENEEAFRLADEVHAWIADGMKNGWLTILPEPSISGLPGFREPENDAAKMLAMKPLEWATKYADTLSANPAWWRLVADFLGSTIPLPLEAMRLLSLRDPTNEPRDLLRRLRSGADRHITMPALVRLLLADPSEVDARRKTLWKLAQLGFADALAGEDIVALFQEFDGLEGAFPQRVMSRMEWMARAPGHLGSDMAQLRIARAYAAAIFTSFCGCAEATDEADGTMGQNGRALPPAESQSLAQSLLRRAEKLTADTRADVLDKVMGVVALRAISAPRLAWQQTDDAKSWTPRTDSPLAALWRFLRAWAGEDGSRRAALDRALREAWLALDGRDENARAVMSMALAHAADTSYAPGQLDLTEPAVETESILSAGWATRPLQRFAIALGGEDSLSFEQILTAAARPGASLKVDARGRFVGLEEADGAHRALRAFLPVEAVLLRQSAADAQQFANQLKRLQGPHDGRVYKLWEGLERTPERESIRRALARRAVSALWRAVRDDPTYLVRWPKSHRLSEGVSRPSLRELRAILSEPNELEPKGQHLGAILFARHNEGVWRGRNDRWELLLMAMEVPGPLSIGPVASMLENDHEIHAAEALRILEHIEDHPIARAARSIFLLRAGASRKPVLRLPSGTTVDLRERLPAVFRKVLEHVANDPLPNTFAAAEAALIRVCGQVIRDLAGAKPIPFREGLWLSYRLFQWLCAQLDALPPQARAAGINRLCSLAPGTEPPRDRLDPFGFDRDLFDHRLAAVLHSLGAMGEILQGLGSGAGANSSPHTLRLVWEPAMIDILLDLSSREEQSNGLDSELAWDAPDNIADLALVALLRIDPNAFGRIVPEARLSRFRRLPPDPNSMSGADERLFLVLIAGAASNPEHCSDEERIALLEGLRAAPTGPVTDRWRMSVYAAFFAAQHPDVTEEAALAALLNALDDPLAPMTLTYLLFGVARRDISHMRDVLHQIISEAERRQIDPVPFAAGLARVFLRVDEPLGHTVIELVRELALRPPFEGDERMRELMTAFGGE